MACLWHVYSVSMANPENFYGIFVADLGQVCGTSMAYLLHMWYVLGIISGIPLWCLDGISTQFWSNIMAYSWDIYGASRAYLLHICLWHSYKLKEAVLNMLWHISGTSRKVLWNINIYCTHMANLWNIYGIPIAHVVCLRNHIWHMYGMFLLYM